MFANTGEARKFRAYYALGMFAVALFVGYSAVRIRAVVPEYAGFWDTVAIWYAVIVGTALLAYNAVTYKKYLATLA